MLPLAGAASRTRPFGAAPSTRPSQVLRLDLRRLTLEVDTIPAGVASFLILAGVGLMNYLSQRRLQWPARSALAADGSDNRQFAANQGAAGARASGASEPPGGPVTIGVTSNQAAQPPDSPTSKRSGALG